MRPTFQGSCYDIRNKESQKKWGKGRLRVYDKKQDKIVWEDERMDIEPIKTFDKNISIWNPEWSYLATGQKLTKRQLKNYCKRNGKMEA